MIEKLCLLKFTGSVIDLKKTFPFSDTIKKAPSRILTLILLGLGVHLLLPQIATLEKSWDVLTGLMLWAVGLAFAAQFCSYLAYGFLMKETLAIARLDYSWKESILMILGGSSVGMVAGGMVGMAAAFLQWTKPRGGSLKKATFAAVLPIMINNLTWIFVSIFGLGNLILIHDLSKPQMRWLSIALVFMALAIILITLAVTRREQTIELMSWYSKQMARLRNQHYDPAITRSQAASIYSVWDILWMEKWHNLALGSALTVAFDMLTLFFLFTAAGIKITLGVLVSGYALPLVIGKIAFLLPGGIGVVESSMAALYTSLGIPNATAVVVILSYRLISFWIPGILGFPVAAYLQNHFNQELL